MYFSGNRDEVVYIMISIKIYIDKDMNIGHYFCDVLDYNTETWWRCDDDIITNYSGYPENVYDDVSHEYGKKGNRIIMNGSDMIVSMLYMKRDILTSRTYSFLLGNHYPKILKILRREKLNLKFP